MTIQNVDQLCDAETNGNTQFFTFRKTPSQTTANGIWFDLSMSPGNPVPNYYAASPNVAIALAQSTDGGLYHGGDVSSFTATTDTYSGSIHDFTFTDTIHGTGMFEVGSVLSGVGVTPGTMITALGTGTGKNNGGTYTVNRHQHVTSQTITGVNSTGVVKYVKTIAVTTTTATAVPMAMYLLDYLMFYPFVDMSDTVSTGIQLTTNIALPRYPTGVGVQIMPVVVAAPSGAGNPQFQVEYYDTDDVLRMTPVHFCNTQVVSGTVVHSKPVGIAGEIVASERPFMTLAPGSKGVKKIDKVYWLGSGDIGLVAFVLVKPVTQLSIRTITAPVERQCFTDFTDMPPVADDAYLNFCVLPPGTLASSNIQGYLQTVFG